MHLARTECPPPKTQAYLLSIVCPVVTFTSPFTSKSGNVASCAQLGVTLILVIPRPKTLSCWLPQGQSLTLLVA